MPNSYTFFKPEVKQWFKNNVPTSKRILDVGPGQGTYSDLLKDLGYRMDAIEIWEPYINQFDLRKKYDNVYIGDICQFNWEDYDFVILGDVLEHISEENAQSLIIKMIEKGVQHMVAIPYMMEQDGDEYGNIYETHLQSDLTPTIMEVRYPNLTPLYFNEWYGYYISKDTKLDKAYVLYGTENYLDTIKGCVESIKQFSNIPIIVYMLNSDAKIPETITIRYNCNVKNLVQNKYINRANSNIYNILIQRPAIIKEALKLSKLVAYVDSDSVATKHVDRIFDYFPENNSYPYFTKGIYDWMSSNGRGWADDINDLSGTLEHPACELFNINQKVRKTYRQTGYFVAGQWCEEFLNEWMWMCNHPKLLQNPQYYAPFHEETVANILLWKWNVHNGLPYVYINGSLDRVGKYMFTGQIRNLDYFLNIPAKEDELLFYHGEKDLETMRQMSIKLGQTSKLKILFVAPHLSTGGMPAFLLKRIELLKKNTNTEIFVVEFKNYSSHFIVQKEKIKELVGNNFITLKDDKSLLIDIIKANKIDIIHIDEIPEGFDDFNKFPDEVLSALYSNERTWRVVETCHNVVFNPNNKIYHPDAYAFCTPYHLDTFKDTPSYKKVIEFPIEKTQISNPITFDYNRKHVLNVGLWTPGKNQAEAIQVAKLMPHVDFHFIGNQAPNFKHYWEPLMKDLPSNVHIWGERNDVDKFMQGADVFLFNSTFECNPLVLREAIGYGLPVIARNLPQYKDMFTEYIIDLDADNLIDQINEQIESPKQYTIPIGQNTKFVVDHMDLYNHLLEQDPQEQIEDIFINCTFVKNPFVEIKGKSLYTYTAKFLDDTNNCIYETKLKANEWAKVNREWYTKWKVQIWKDDTLLYENKLDYTNQRVYIAIDSKSLGDTIAWLPYCLEFKNKHNCHVIVSTHKNFLFKKVYPELEFVQPGEVVKDILGMYTIGWFYNLDKEPTLCNTVKLQEAATNILGLDYQEIKPRISFIPSDNLYGKYITIATNSTAECKFWTKEGWQEVIDYLTTQGYKVVNVSKEKNFFWNCTQIEDTSIENTMNVIYHSEFFIGLSSGLSWLAWALGKHVIMISNFTKYDHEFLSNCTRIVNELVCHGCWNNPLFKFDRGDWYWCPEHKDTDRQFECHKSITGTDVINVINHLL